jgi:hypothetical protein
MDRVQSGNYIAILSFQDRAMVTQLLTIKMMSRPFVPLQHPEFDVSDGHLSRMQMGVRILTTLEGLPSRSEYSQCDPHIGWFPKP